MISDPSHVYVWCGPHGACVRQPRPDRQVQRQARRAEALAEWSVELAQAMIPQALALVRGGG